MFVYMTIVLQKVIAKIFIVILEFLPALHAGMHQAMLSNTFMEMSFCVLKLYVSSLTDVIVQLNDRAAWSQCIHT